MGWLQRLKEMAGNEAATVLMLSGGGARGLAHIGVLQELERIGIRPDLVTGTSMGAVVGALYCLRGNSYELDKAAREVIESDEFKRFGLEDLVRQEQGAMESFEEFGVHVRRLFMLTRMVRKESLVEGNQLHQVMEHLFGDTTFDDVKIPFVAVATDLISGHDIHISSGSIAQAVAASSSLPGVFPPVRIDNWLLVDGGVTKNVPIPEPDDTPENSRLIAVDVMQQLRDEGPYEHGVDIITRTDWITMLHLNQFFLDQADLVLVPRVRNIHWADFRSLDGLIEAGRQAVVQRREKLEKLLIRRL